MNIKIHSSELNRMMKILTQCIDQKDANKGNIEVIYDNNLLTLRGTNGSFSAVMSTPVLGGDGESFCVDGTLFARVVGMCNGEISLITDGRTCTVKGAGRTRLPIVNAVIPAFDRVKGDSVSISGVNFISCYNAVAYAISSEQTRPVLTGVMLNTADGMAEMTTLDGFQMATEYTECDGDCITAVIPGAFMKLISTGVSAGEHVKLTVGKGKVQASTDGMLLSCTLLKGDFPDHKKIVPTSFTTNCLLKSDALRDALKCGSVINTGNNLVKMKVNDTQVVVMSNSEQADFEAEIPCERQGNELVIAFNQKYLMNTINAVSADEIVLNFNTSVSPCVVQAKGQDGIHLVLPVRVK